ncbi:MAG TPA: DUF2059 domain-containing protein [Burkholderiaceae bacterium]
MKKLLAISALGLCCVLPVQAQTNVGGDVNAAARELVVAMNTRQTMSGAMRTMQPMMKSMTAEHIRADPASTAEQKAAQIAKLDQGSAAMAEELQTLFSDPVFLDEIEAVSAASYAKYYTIDELKQLTAFHKSPVGMKMKAMMPQVAQDSMAAVQKVLMPRFRELSKKFAQRTATQ